MDDRDAGLGRDRDLDDPGDVNAGTSGDTITNAVSNIVLDQTDSNTTPDTQSVDINVNNGLDLVVTKTVDDATPDEGQAVTYTVTITNNGPSATDRVRLTAGPATVLRYLLSPVFVTDEGIYSATTIAGVANWTGLDLAPGSSPPSRTASGGCSAAGSSSKNAISAQLSRTFVAIV